MCAFVDAELQSLSRAFDRAWDRYLRTGLLTRHNLHESRHLLASRILRAAHFGEWDEWRLARDAVDYLLQLKHRETHSAPRAGRLDRSRPKPRRRSRSLRIAAPAVAA
jgi:hypothetical protein